MDHRHADRALTDGRGDSLDVVGPDVAGREHAGHTCLELQRRAVERPRLAVDVPAGQDEAMAVALHCRWEPVGPGGGPDEDEQSGGWDALGRPAGAVCQLEPLQSAIAATVGDLGAGAYVDVSIRLDLPNEV